MKLQLQSKLGKGDSKIQKSLSNDVEYFWNFSWRRTSIFVMLIFAINYQQDLKMTILIFFVSSGRIWSNQNNLDIKVFSFV